MRIDLYVDSWVFAVLGNTIANLLLCVEQMEKLPARFLASDIYWLVVSAGVEVQL